MENGLTAEIARRAAHGRDGFDDPEVRRLVGHCLLDWTACAVAGAHVPASRSAAALALEEGAAPVATVVGATRAVAPMAAARANGVISHALDFDDANLAMPGHPGVVLFPALLALAEARGSTGRALVDAFLAGYDAGCRIGSSVAPGHYARGFHATGTIGTFAAATACGRLLGLDTGAMRRAIGLAATQAAGLISMFGTHAKPLHAGNAAANGLLSALLAARGFTAREDALECALGFAATHGPDFVPEAALAPLPGGHPVRRNLFKLHAACYGTHATIEGAIEIRLTPGFRPEFVREVHIDVGEECTRTCDIRRPVTGEEAKFSLRFNVAAALLGYPTERLSTYEAATVSDPAIVALRDRVQARFVPGRPLTLADVRVVMTDGRVLAAHADTGEPRADIDAQERLLTEKFNALAVPGLPSGGADELRRLALAPDALDEVGRMTHLLRFDARPAP